MLNKNMAPKMVCGGVTVISAYPLYDVSSYTQPRQGSTYGVAPSGIEDAWVIASDDFLKCSVRWIPETGDASHTGWSDGWRSFLANARQGNVITLYPNSAGTGSIACYLEAPLKGGWTTEGDQLTRKCDLVLRASGSLEFTGY